MAIIIPAAKKYRVITLAQMENSYSFHWTFDEGQFELNFQDEAVVSRQMITYPFD
jgi:hypothetical protein